jgi:hypothetical protein
VWTGAEVIVWGGFDSYGTDSHRRDGAAYDPVADAWRVIARGPLTERARHLATWTGDEMLIWGPRGKNYIQPPDGAAYDPVTDSWREIAAGPLSWANDASGVWTGTEWVIASGVEHAMEIAAYDPGDDAWRRLPDVPEWSTASLFWTGSELLASTDAGVFRLATAGDSWHSISADGPSSLLTASEENMLGASDPFSATPGLTLWTAEATTWRDLPQAPRNPLRGLPVWAGERLIFLGSGLAFDLGTWEWWNLGTSLGNPRQYGITLWIGDRLFEWGGGTLGHVDPQPHLKGYVLIPEW